MYRLSTLQSGDSPNFIELNPVFAPQAVSPGKLLPATTKKIKYYASLPSSHAQGHATGKFTPEKTPQKKVELVRFRECCWTDFFNDLF